MCTCMSNNSFNKSDYPLISIAAHAGILDVITQGTPKIISIETSLRNAIVVLLVAFLMLFIALVLILIVVVRHYK